MKAIYKTVLSTFIFLGAWIALAQQTPDIKSTTPANYTANDAVVRRINLLIPTDKQKAEKVLWDNFANKPEEKRFGSVTTEEWEKKWDEFSNELIKKASKEGFTGVGAALKRLNYGRNEMTNLCPVTINVNNAPPNVKIPREDKPIWEIYNIWIPSDISKEEEAKIIKEVDAENHRREDYAKAHPEEYVDTHVASVPVGAYVANYAETKCWIIVCKWEDLIEDRKASQMGHIRIYALTYDGSRIIAFVGCD